MKRICYCVLLLLVTFSCDNGPDEPVLLEVSAEELNDTGGDYSSNEMIDELDHIPSAQIDVAKIILPNGTSLEDFEAMGGRKEQLIEDHKNQVLVGIFRKAEFLLDRVNHIKDKGNQNDQPAQPNGLAYASGNKNYKQREKPSAIFDKNFEGVTSESVFGLDGAGFIAELFGDVLAGEIPAGVKAQSDITKWNVALESTFQSNDTKMVNKGQLPVDKLETGDLIYWLDNENSHIGLVAKLSGPTRFLFNSNGSAGLNCIEKKNDKYLIDDNTKFPVVDEPCIAIENEKNRSTTRGPRIMSMAEATTGTGFWGRAYSVLRLESSLDCRPVMVDDRIPCKLEYDDMHRLTKVWLEHENHPDELVGEYFYDDKNRINKIIERDEVSNFTYGEFGWTQIDVDDNFYDRTTIISAEYDDVGNRIKVIDFSVTYQYSVTYEFKYVDGNLVESTFTDEYGETVTSYEFDKTKINRQSKMFEYMIADWEYFLYEDVALYFGSPSRNLISKVITEGVEIPLEIMYEIDDNKLVTKKIITGGDLNQDGVMDERDIIERIYEYSCTP